MITAYLLLAGCPSIADNGKGGGGSNNALFLVFAFTFSIAWYFKFRAAEFGMVHAEQTVSPETAVMCVLAQLG